MESGPPTPDRPTADGPQAPIPKAPPYQPMPGPEGPRGGWDQPIAAGPGWIGLPLASWGSRVGAAIIDALILTVPVVGLIVLVIVVAAGSDVGAIVTGIVSTLAYILVALFYAPVLMARQGDCNGQSWGKQLVGIRVVRDGGEPVEFGWAFLREFVVKTLLFGFIGGFFFYIPTAANYLWPLWDDQNRCLHDMVVSTHVVH